MITIQDKSNRNLYMDYFAEVSEKSGLDITCLEDVFDQITTLRENKDTKRFTRLPLDEEPFEINLDTRVITVPSVFSKNGVSVKGDVVSETIYFKCYRYYDNMDLAGTEVYIQYTNAENREIIAPASMVDIESEPGYMLIEWPISGIAAAAAGNLKFAVRFCEFDDETDELLYSLATLTQTVKINDSLDFDFTNGIKTNHIEDGLDKLMLARLKDKNLDGLPSIVKASDPEYVISLTAGPQNLDAQDDSGKLTLTVSAINDEGGVISYYLYKDGSQVTTTDESGEEVPVEFTFDYVPVDYTEPVEGICYYSKADDETEYTKIGDVESFETGVNYFEGAYSVVVDSVGEYYVTATNRVRMTITDEIQTPEDGVVTVPAATDVEAPKIVERAYTDSDDENVLDGTTVSSDDGGVISYLWYKDGLQYSGEDAKNSKLTVVEDGTYKVFITNYLNKTTKTVWSNDSRVTALPLKPEMSYDTSSLNDKNYVAYDYLSDVDGGFKVTITPQDANRVEEDSITYQWYEYATGRWVNDAEDAALNSAKSAFDGDYNLDASDYNDHLLQKTTFNKGANKTSDTLAVKDIIPTKYYYCLITNTYNNKSTTICSPFFRVENTN